MEITLKLSIKPFTVPNFVVVEEPPASRQQGFKPSEGIPLSELDSETLWEMCEHFRTSVFLKAGKNYPPQQAPICEECGRGV